MIPLRLSLIAFAAIGLLSDESHATLSIVACETSTGRCGVAVATHNLAVGHGVPFAEAGVGAGVSQFETNACHSAAALQALRAGEAPADALALALAASPRCPDGLDDRSRQTAVVAMRGLAAVHTGAFANHAAGHRVGERVAVQGNGLVSDAVLDAMWMTYHSADGPLGERLLQALEAGQAAGGQQIGVLSAALRVATPEGWPVDVDLRIDFAPATAVADLRVAYDASVARTLLFRAARHQDDHAAQALVASALGRAPSWDRVWMQAAMLADHRGWPTLATKASCGFRALNAQWARDLDDLPPCARPDPP